MTYIDLVTYLKNQNATLVAVSKTRSVSAIQKLYNQGQRIFGENRVQEMVEKQKVLPSDIEWHMIGRIQKNKVKLMSHFISMIHSVDNQDLIDVINKQAIKHNRVIDILLQIKIATEESKGGWDFSQLEPLIINGELNKYQNIRVRGLMGMATFTQDKQQVNNEFKTLKSFFDILKKKGKLSHFDTLSMGMSGDYDLALSNGSTMVRIGSLIFGPRTY